MTANDRVFGLVANQAVKNPCRLATTENIALSGLQTIDGEVLVALDRVLVKDQTDTVENGIYVADTGAWERAMDVDGSYDLVNGSFLKVLIGTQAGFWECTGTEPIVVGTTAITFGLGSSPLASISGFAQTFLDDPDAATARTTLQLDSGDAGDIWVNTSGDTMTGDLTMSAAANFIVRDNRIDILANGSVNKHFKLNINGHAVGTKTMFPVDEDFVIGTLDETPNMTFAAAISSSALTYDLRTMSGANYSPDSPIYLKFRNNTLNLGTYTTVVQDFTLTFIISAGSTLGTVSGVPCRLYVGVAYDSGTVRQWIYNPYDAVNNTLVGLDENRLYSSTAEGSAGAADAPQTLYSIAAFTNRAIKILGYIETTQTIAGTWTQAITKLHMLHAGDPRTGHIIQSHRFATGALVQGAVVTPIDDTVPQSTEGSSFMGITILPRSAANLIRVQTMAQLSCATTASMVMALHTSASSSAVAATKVGALTANELRPYLLEHQQTALSTASQTFTLRVGASTTANCMLNGESTARLLGGVSNSYIEAQEIVL